MLQRTENRLQFARNRSPRNVLMHTKEIHASSKQVHVRSQQSANNFQSKALAHETDDEPHASCPAK